MGARRGRGTPEHRTTAPCIPRPHLSGRELGLSTLCLEGRTDCLKHGPIESGANRGRRAKCLYPMVVGTPFERGIKRPEAWSTHGAEVQLDTAPCVALGRCRKSPSGFETSDLNRSDCTRDCFGEGVSVEQQYLSTGPGCASFGTPSFDRSQHLGRIAHATVESIDCHPVGTVRVGTRLTLWYRFLAGDLSEFPKRDWKSIPDPPQRLHSNAEASVAQHPGSDPVSGAPDTVACVARLTN